MDVKNLVAAANKVGHSEVPVGSGGNNSEAAQVLVEIFKAYPAKYFRSGDLGDILNDGGVKVNKIGNVLFQMKNAKQCSQVKKGVYTTYNSKYDGNISKKSAPESNTESE